MNLFIVESAFQTHNQLIERIAIDIIINSVLQVLSLASSQEKYKKYCQKLNQLMSICKLFLHTIIFFITISTIRASDNSSYPWEFIEGCFIISIEYPYKCNFCLSMYIWTS